MRRHQPTPEQKAAAAGPDMQAFVYLAGRGVQYNGDNYFVPVDAQINRDADVPIDAIRIADFAHALADYSEAIRLGSQPGFAWPSWSFHASWLSFSSIA